MSNQLTVINDHEWDLAFTDQIERIVNQAVQEGVPDKAFELGKNLQTIYNATDKALAKLAFTLKDRWIEFGLEESFEDVALQWWNIKPITLSRYIRTYDMLQSGDIPAEYQEEVEKMPMRDLVPIATTWASGFPITEDKWQELIDAENSGEVQEKLRDIKGEEPRTSAFVIRLSRDGTLKAYAGKGNGVYVGYLVVEKMDEDEVVKKAITRIINGSNIVEE